jgi:hypothetical protein
MQVEQLKYRHGRYKRNSHTVMDNKEFDMVDSIDQYGRQYNYKLC